jgi:hypothetical protein
MTVARELTQRHTSTAVYTYLTCACHCSPMAVASGLTCDVTCSARRPSWLGFSAASIAM